MEAPPELVSTLRGTTPVFSVRSRLPRGHQTILHLRVGAGLFVLFALLAFAVFLPVGLHGGLRSEDGTVVSSGEAAIGSVIVGTMMVAGALAFLYKAKRASTPPGPWYAGLEKELVVITERKTLHIPWGAFETVAVQNGTIVLRGRHGLSLGDSLTQNGRQFFEIVDVPDAAGLARTCAVLIAGSPPVTFMDEIKDAVGLPGGNVPR